MRSGSPHPPLNYTTPNIHQFSHSLIFIHFVKSSSIVLKILSLNLFNIFEGSVYLLYHCQVYFFDSKKIK